MLRDRLVRWWTKWGTVIQAAVFAVGFYALMVGKHNAFHTFALDLGKFDQAIWNTLHGRFLFSTLQNRSILANHFSPYMAVLSPLFLLWSDVRALFAVHVLGLAVAGLLLAEIVRREHPGLAPWFSLAFYLNPALHEVTLTEVRRVTFAVPYLALACYALYTRRRVWMAVGLGVALLCKENIAVVVFAVGMYLLLFERDWRWGSVLTGVGAAWAIVVTFWVVAAFRAAAGEQSVYPQLNYFGLSGDSYRKVLANLAADPFAPLRQAFDAAGLRALWRVLMPVGLVLSFLAPDWALIFLPSIGYMLMSSAPGMHRLENWYMASVLPALFAATGVGLTRLSPRRAQWATVSLVACSLAGYAWFSHAPLGARYEPALYHVTDHERLASIAIGIVPNGATVAAQDPYVPHLSHREHIYLYPWISIDRERIEYIVLDRKLNPYPLQPHQMAQEIDNLVADTTYTIEFEADGIYVFHRRGAPLPALPVGQVAESAIRLDRIEIAVLDERGIYQPATEVPIEVAQGAQVRLALYWEALQTPPGERTVSVRIAPTEGGQRIAAPLAAIHDSLPGGGNKPTSWWRPGWQIRDVHYVVVSPDARLGEASLDVVLYDSVTGDIVQFEGQGDILAVGAMRIVASPQGG